MAEFYSSMPLDLVIPHLLLPPDAPPRLRSARLPHAERWLARADIRDEAGGDALRWIARTHRIPEPHSIAAICLAGEGREAHGPWLRADPVHLRVENDDLVLHDAAILGLAMEESRALAASLNAHFAADGFAIEPVAPDRWYLGMPPGTPPRTVPLDEAFGRNIFGMLPRGGDFNWAGALTEAQMVLAGHAVNAAREPGKPAVNSIWFWGEGHAPATIERRYDAIHASDAFARGIAALSGATALPAATRLGDVQSGGSVLVVDDSLTAPLRRGDTDAWLAAAARIDAAWFSDLAPALTRFESVRIVLPSESRTRVATLTPAARWRWLRARKPLVAHA
jgi:hypothetical protein